MDADPDDLTDDELATALLERIKRSGSFARSTVTYHLEPGSRRKIHGWATTDTFANTDRAGVIVVTVADDGTPDEYIQIPFDSVVAIVSPFDSLVEASRTSDCHEDFLDPLIRA